MESEDGTGSRHAHAVFKEMWIATHLFHFCSKAGNFGYPLD
jgi:hypothetical protein